MGFFSNFQASDAIDIANLFIKPSTPNPVAPATQYIISGAGVGAGAGTAYTGSGNPPPTKGDNNMLLIVGGVLFTILIAVLGFLFTKKSKR